jgi:hypothetical protein
LLIALLILTLLFSCQRGKFSDYRWDHQLEPGPGQEIDEQSKIYSEDELPQAPSLAGGVRVPHRLLISNVASLEYIELSFSTQNHELLHAKPRARNI